MPDARATSSHPIRRLYDWVLGWADSSHALAALLCLAFMESSFFPIPPDVLLIAMAIGAPQRGLFFAFWCSLASVIGGVVGYGIGLGLMEAVGCKVVSFYHGAATFDWVATKFDTYNFWAVFVAAVTPIPYKIFTITAGAVHADFGMFFLASVLGRPIRFFAIAILILLFGQSVRRFIDRYFNLLSVAFVILLIGGFALLTTRNHSQGEKVPQSTESRFSRICDSDGR